MAGFDFRPYGLVINAAAYTAVDAAETEDGRREAWAVNVGGVAALVEAARRHRFTWCTSHLTMSSTAPRCSTPRLSRFHRSASMGKQKQPVTHWLPPCPRTTCLRTSWLIGDGHNFVRTMASLADRGVSPEVVNDQFGRLTFTTEIGRAIMHLLQVEAPYGTYNLSNDGEPMTWADIARAVFQARGRDAASVKSVTTAEYAAGKSLAPRPEHSVLSLDKIISSGFRPADAMTQLQEYLSIPG